MLVVNPSLRWDEPSGGERGRRGGPRCSGQSFAPLGQAQRGRAAEGGEAALVANPSLRWDEPSGGDTSTNNGQRTRRGARPLRTAATSLPGRGNRRSRGRKCRNPKRKRGPKSAAALTLRVTLERLASTRELYDLSLRAHCTNDGDPTKSDGDVLVAFLFRLPHALAGRRPTVHPAQGNALGNGSHRRVPCRPNGPAVRRKNRWPVGPMHPRNGSP